MSLNSEEYLVTVTVSEDDKCSLIICRMDSRNIKFIKKLSGEEAKKTYELLTVKE